MRRYFKQKRNKKDPKQKRITIAALLIAKEKQKHIETYSLKYLNVKKLT